MRALIQRVSRASVSVAGRSVAAIGPGMLVLLGIARDDSEQDLLWLSGKIALMRIFEDPDGRMNLSLADSGGGALVVSQFTLHASTRKGNRPSFLGAAPPDQAALLYDGFCRALSARLRCPVGRGRFGAAMSVSLVNEGPVTIFMDSKNPE